MKLLTTTLMALITLSMASFACSSQPLTPEELFSDSSATHLTLSPTGEYIAYVTPGYVFDVLTTAQRADLKPIFTSKTHKRNYIHAIQWANDKQLLLLQGVKYDKLGNTLFSGESQALNYDGSKKFYIWQLFQQKISTSKYKAFYNPYYIQSLLPTQPKQIIVSTHYRRTGSLGDDLLLNINIDSKTLLVRERAKVKKPQFVFSTGESPIAQLGEDKLGATIGFYKDKADKWQPLPKQASTLALWLIDDEHLALKRDGGNNVYQLYRFNRLTQKTDLIATSKGTDFRPILTKHRRLIGYVTEHNGKPHKAFLDEKGPEAQLRRTFERSFAEHQVDVTSSSDNGRQRIVKVWSDIEPGKFYLYDADAPKAKLKSLSTHKPEIERERFSSMMPISFRARDGKTVRGYISEPKNTLGNNPMIVMVHGKLLKGRDYWGWSAQTQLLTSHGYTVLQINYRGSDGLGENFKKAGHQQFGKSVVNDVIDGTEWAVKQGFANKDKICIYGDLYGGYLSMMAAAKAPELYQCAISYNGIYDLAVEHKSFNLHIKEARKIYLSTTLGDDMKALGEDSPINAIAQIKSDLFLIHDTKDRQVDSEHFSLMTEALDNAQKPYEKLEGRYFYKQQNQLNYYNKLLQFLSHRLK